MGRRRYPEEIVQEVVEKYRKGIGSPSLSKEYGISKPTILDWARKAGVIRSDSEARKMRAIPEDVIDEAVELYKSGKTYQEIADILGHSRTPIMKHVKRRIEGKDIKRPKKKRKLSEEHKRKISESTRGVSKRRGEIKDTMRDVTENLAYVVGVCMFDGHVSREQGIRLEAKDRDFVEEFKRCFVEQFGVSNPISFLPPRITEIREIRGKKHTTKNGTYLFKVSNVVITEFVEGLMNGEWVQSLDEGEKISWLRGAWDSEGWVGNYKSGRGTSPRIGFVNTDRNKIDLYVSVMQEILNRGDAVRVYTKRQGEKDIHNAMVYKRDTVCEFFKKIDPTIGRKRDVFEDICHQ
jgi:transposase-like protein